MKVYLCEPIGLNADHFRSELQEHDVIDHDTRGLDDASLLALIKEAEILVLTNRPISGELMRNLPYLKLIVVAFTGLDHIDLVAAKQQNIKVINTPGYANTAVAELTIGLMISLARRLKHNFNQINHGISTNTGLELYGKTLGLVGYGRIGKAVAQLATAFNMNIIYFSARDQTIQLEDLFKQADFISLHIPLTDQTRNFIDNRLLSLMKKNSYLINCARGPIVNQNDLYDALKNNKIAGAALDVFDVEPPLPVDLPLLTLENVIATPHIGFNTQEALVSKGKMAIELIKSFESTL